MAKETASFAYILVSCREMNRIETKDKQQSELSEKLCSVRSDLNAQFPR